MSGRQCPYVAWRSLESDHDLPIGRWLPPELQPPYYWNYWNGPWSDMYLEKHKWSEYWWASIHRHWWYLFANLLWKWRRWLISESQKLLLLKANSSLLQHENNNYLTTCFLCSALKRRVYILQTGFQKSPWRPSSWHWMMRSKANNKKNILTSFSKDVPTKRHCTFAL